MRLRFNWALVSDAVVAALLRTVYAHDPEAIDGLADAAHRRAQAHAVFGTPITRASLDRHPGTWAVLRDEWLLKEATTQQLASIATLVRRTLSGEARAVNLNNRESLRTFFRERSFTDNLRANLHTGFKAAHRNKQPSRGGRGGTSNTGVNVSPLVGEGLRETRSLYPHQKEAIEALKAITRPRLPEKRRGLVVIPTGGGKTVTAVYWLLDQMAANPDLRVLWIAHQEELLTQARETFTKMSRHQALGFERKIRLISGGYSAPTTLADNELDVALITVQSLAKSWPTTKRLVRNFMSRPTIVVIDEAHHAGARSYQDVISEVDRATKSILVGLTATPYPSGTRAAARLRDSFQRTLVDVSAESLHDSGILATPTLHTVQTHQALELTPAELRKATGDLPPDVLERLQNAARDGLIARLWMDHKSRWGKTLVFATSRNHADHLGRVLHDQKAPVKVLHGAIAEHRSDVIEWFKTHVGPCVLVSVGMLTEGVDLPDAKTAFLARPTTSSILLRQMIGRVLRGPAAGGSAESNIVYLRDNWINFEDVLDPAELPDVLVDPTSEWAGRRLPPIIDLGTGTQIPEHVLAQIQRMYQQRTDRIPLDPATSRTRLCGYYATMDRPVPVMEHQFAGYEELIALSLADESLQGIPAQRLFDDVYPPYPTHRSLTAIRNHISATGLAPDFIEIEASIDPRDVARRLRHERAMTDKQREQWLLDEYDRSLARIAYPSFEHFEEAVDRELREFRRGGRGEGNKANPENPAPPPRGTEHLPRLRRAQDRSLPTLNSVIARMREVLAGEPILARLIDDDLPDLMWTRREIRQAWAYWSLKSSGRAAGRPVIRVNLLLQAPRTQVSDELLEYLIYHEMLHDLLPGQGHNAEFRRLEALWPDSMAHDLTFDTLHEQFNMERPKSH